MNAIVCLRFLYISNSFCNMAWS